MELEDYLASVDVCPDSELTNEFGLYDNYEILLRAPVDTVIADLLQLQNFQRDQPFRFQMPGRVTFYLLYTATNVRLQFAGKYLGFSDSLCWTEEEKLHNQFRIQTYTTKISLHPQKADDARSLVPVVTEIALYATSKQIPLCLPQSYGMGHTFPIAKSVTPDFSRVVYFPHNIRPIVPT